MIGKFILRRAAVKKYPFSYPHTQTYTLNRSLNLKLCEYAKQIYFYLVDKQFTIDCTIEKFKANFTIQVNRIVDETEYSGR